MKRFAHFYRGVCHLKMTNTTIEVSETFHSLPVENLVALSFVI